MQAVKSRNGVREGILGCEGTQGGKLCFDRRSRLPGTDIINESAQKGV